VASPFDDPLVIAGNASLGEELAATNHRFEWVLAPVGGGGLTAGLVQGLRKANSSAQVLGVEPELANDAARSLRAGQLIPNASEPLTLADGVRTVSLGRQNWEILHEGLAGIVEVSEEQIAQGLRLLFLDANLKVEPTGALAIAALLAKPELFRKGRVCAVLSGGNVDPATFARLLSDHG
jgi:threonine dehydratase